MMRMMEVTRWWRKFPNLCHVAYAALLVTWIHWEMGTVGEAHYALPMVEYWLPPQDQHRDASLLLESSDARNSVATSLRGSSSSAVRNDHFPWEEPRSPSHHSMAQSTLPPTTCAPIHVPVDPALRPGRRQFELLVEAAHIPDVNTQAGRGYSLQGLTAFDGQLHLAYGDSVANSGPLAMHSYHPSTGTWTYKGMLNTEELRVFRTWHTSVANGSQITQRLYTPEIDAHGDDRRRQSVVYQLECGWAAQWSVAGTPIEGSAHVYDLHLSSNNNNDTPTLWASTGSRSNEAAALVESVDNGQTWHDVLRLPVVENAYSRIYFIGRTSTVDFIWGRVHVHQSPQDGAFAMVRYPHDSGNHTNNNLLRPNVFHRIRNLEVTIPAGQTYMPQLRPIVHQDYMVLVAHPFRFGPHVGTYTLAPNNPNRLIPVNPWPVMQADEKGDSQDGTDGGDDDEYDDDDTTTNVVTWTFDEQQDHLFILTTCCRNTVAEVWRTASLQSAQWESLVRLPALPEDDLYFSMTLLLNNLYLGTNAGNLYVVQELYQPAAQPQQPL